MPSFEIEVEKLARMWTLGQTKKAKWNQAKKIRLHARESLNAISKLAVDVPLRRFLVTRRFYPVQWTARALKNWRDSTLTNSQSPRVVEPIKELVPV